MNKITVTGKTVEEAIEQGLQQLQVPRERVEVDILEHPSKGLFGSLAPRKRRLNFM